MIFLTHPSTWILVVILAITLHARGATKMAAAGLICYPLSFAISNAYNFVPYVQAIYLWQGGLLAVLLMYSIVGRVVWPIPFAALSIALYVFDIVSRYSFEFMISVLITGVVFQIYRRTKDVFSAVVWGTLLIFEGWSALEIPGCRVFAKIDIQSILADWARDGGTSVCAVAFGPVAPFFITAVTSTLLLWITLRWNQTSKS